MQISGISLLERAIQRAEKSGVVDRLFVSTEDEEVRSVAEKMGHPPPFMRPMELSRDPAGVVEVALHALEKFESMGESFDRLLILLPSSPFCSAADVRLAMERFDNSCANVLMSVCKTTQSPLTAQIMRDGMLEALHPEWLTKTGAKATTTTPITVNANGAITILDVPSFRREREYYFYPMVAYEMSQLTSIDIDTQEDLDYARYLSEIYGKL